MKEKERGKIYLDFESWNVNAHSNTECTGVNTVVDELLNTLDNRSDGYS